MLVHEDEEGHGPGIISGDLPQTLHDSWIASVIEEGPHVNDVLVRGQLAQALILILVI